MFMVKLRRSSTIKCLCSFLALEKYKVEMTSPCADLENQQLKISSKSCRGFNSHLFGPFPDEKYSILTILDQFYSVILVEFRMGGLKFFFLVYRVDFEKRINFDTYSYRKWPYEVFWRNDS
jgi:hypothetical protein